MKIGIVSTHSFPITKSGTVTHTGDIVIVDLVRSLESLGHKIIFMAPEGSYIPINGKLLPMTPSFGKYPPSCEDIETEAFNKYGNLLQSCDIVHYFGSGQMIPQLLYRTNYKNVVCTLMGGAWTNQFQPQNIVAWTESHKYRIQNGFTDYHNTLMDGLAGPNQPPFKNNIRIVNGGVDSNWYTPDFKNKKNYILWMGRWSKVRGYLQAIEIAKKNPHIEFVFSGGKPENEYFQQEIECAKEAIELTKGISNIKVDLLPADPDHHEYKRKLYREARAFLYNVQFCEPFGMMQAESLCCGTPVIGTNYGSIPEVIEDGITGYVRNNSVEDFTSAISIIDNIDPKICRESAVSRFDIKVMAQNYLTVYQNIINKNS